VRQTHPAYNATALLAMIKVSKSQWHSGEVFEVREEIARCVQMVRGEATAAATGRDGLWSAGLCLVAQESIR
jgi:myo-inositol 2-dehydrogenase/D-chiro-inositol 1-dehydrogenase